MALYFYNGLPLFRNGGWAANANCCCNLCTCVPDLPDILYLSVAWCGDTSVIQLDLYLTDVEGDNCEKRYSGSGDFGAGGPAFFRVSVLESAGVLQIRYCFDGCTTGECDPSVVSNVALWTSFANISCNPLYGDYYADYANCGICMGDPAFTLVLTT